MNNVFGSKFINPFQPVTQVKKSLGALGLMLFVLVFVLSISSIRNVSASVPMLQSAWSTGGSTSAFKDALGIAVDSSGNVFVADTGNHRVRKLSSAGAYVAYLGGTYSSSGNGGFNSPNAIAVDSAGNVYVADTNNNRIEKLSNDLVWQSHVVSYGVGSGNGQVSYPRGIALDSADNIYVSDTGNNRIQKYDSSGVYISQFGSAGTGDGQFSSPRGIAVDASGNIYVADTGNNRIQKFDSSGNFLAKFGSGVDSLTWDSGTVTASNLGQFSAPYDVAVASDGSVYVANRAPAVTTLGSIQHLDSNGVFLMPLLGLKNPGGVDVDASGNLYVIDTYFYYARKYSLSTTGYQIANLPGTLNATDRSTGANIESSGLDGLNNVAAPIRLKTTAGLAISDLSVDLTADRDWATVTADADRPSGKSFVNALIGAPGADSTHTLYVPVPLNRTSVSVYLCPDATDLASVTTSCSNGVKRSAGSFTEAFGNIVVSQVNDLGDNVTYWKITGMTGSGGIADDIVTFSGAGAGTVESPYEITTCDQFQSMKDLREYHFAIANSIDCSATSGWNGGKGFIPIGATVNEPFLGSLTGTPDYTVSGIYIQMTDITAAYGIGVFGYTDGATFSQVHLINVLIEKGGYDSDNVGGFIGVMKDGSITDSNVTGAITQTSGDQDVDGAWVDNYGGMVGWAQGTASITFSTVDVDITLLSGNEAIGGLVGQTTDTVVIEDSVSYGFLHTSYNAYQVGGFIGWQLGSSTIARCHSTGEVHVGIGAEIVFAGDNYDVGGFIGGLGGDPGLPITSASIIDSYATGNVIVDGEDSYDHAGFVGTLYDGGTITNSYSTGSVTMTGVYSNAVGGFVGLTRQRFTNAAPSIVNSYSTGAVVTTFDAYDIGGFVGEHRDGTITTSHSTGNVTVAAPGDEAEYSWAIGGFVGYTAKGTISKSYATGNVLTVGYADSVGGFVGQFNGGYGSTTPYIEQSYSTGNVEGSDSVGGFVGYLNHSGLTETIRDSYSRGNAVAHADYTDASIGGFAGYLEGVILENVYSTGTVTSTLESLNSGGLVGSTLGGETVTNSYWDTETSLKATSIVGTAHTTAEMKDSANFTGWSFGPIWLMGGDLNNGYPIIKFQGPPASLPTVTTGDVSVIQEFGATVAGNVTSDGSGIISERGMVYSTSNETPTTSDSKQTTTGTTGVMSVPITGLSAVTLYYVRAYVVNEIGTAYGDVVSFTTLSPNLAVTSSIITNPTTSGTTVTLRSIVTNVTATTAGDVVFTNVLDPALETVSASVTSAIGNQLFSVSSMLSDTGLDAIRELDPDTGATLSSVTVTMAGRTIQGNYGVATHPLTHTIYLISRTGSGNGSDVFVLASVNPYTGVATEIGPVVTSGGSPVALKISAIAFRADGTLYAVTGDGNSSLAETLFTLNLSDATATQVMALGNGNDGEAIAFGSDGLLYHASGYGDATSVVFEKIDVDTQVITNIVITGDTDLTNIQGLSYKAPGEFYAAGFKDSNGDDVIATLSSTGLRDEVRVVDHNSKGLAYALPLPAVCSNDANTITCNLGNIRSTSEVTATYTITTLAKIPNAASIGTQYTNTATVALTGTELVTNNNSASSTITVAGLLPTVTTGATSALTGSGVTIAGNVSSDGGATITQRGIVFSTTNATPTISNGKQVTTGTTGAMSVALTNLNSLTHYYARAFATNSSGTSYGSVVQFTTLAVAPTVTTGVSSAVTSATATIAGNVTSDGGATVNERGIVYSSTVTSPTTANSKKTTTGTTGSMSVGLTGLAPVTLYYARAYATNSRGTSYGSVVQFTTLAGSTLPNSLKNVYVTFGKFKFEKYRSPAELRAGDTAYIKNFNASQLKLIQIFFYDFAKGGNQGFTASKVTPTSMFLRTTSLLPTGKRYAYVFKFQDKATGIIATKYFVMYTTKTWLGHSVLGATTIASTVTGETTELPVSETPSPTVLAETDIVVAPSTTEPVLPPTTVVVTTKEPEMKEVGAKSSSVALVTLFVVALGGIGIAAWVFFKKPV